MELSLLDGLVLGGAFITTTIMLVLVYGPKVKRDGSRKECYSQWIKCPYCKKPIGVQ